MCYDSISPSALLRPICLFLAIENFLDCFKYHGIGSLHCVVGLWVVHKGECYLHPNLMIKILKHVIIKLIGIVDGDFSWNTEVADDVLPEKILDGHRAYVGDRLRLNPLCEILDCYNGEGVIALSWS
jgi:hypothetical protein